MTMDKKIEKRRWYMRKQLWFAVGGGVLVVILYFLLFGDSKKRIELSRKSIEIARVEYGTFQDYISSTGKVEPIRTIYLDAEEGGRVEQLFVEEGEMVHKDQPILRLSNSDLHLSIMNSEASLAEQTTRMRDTRLAMEQQRTSIKNQIIELKFKIQKQRRLHDHNKKFIEQGIISKDDFAASEELLEEMTERYALIVAQSARDSVSREVQLCQLDESLALMHNNLGMVRQKLDNLLLKAPVDGQLATLNAEIGETKQKGQRLGVVNVLTAYKIHAEIDEHYIDKLEMGLEAQFERNGNTFMLTVTKVYPDVKNGTFGVDMKFRDSVPKNIRTGQSYHLTISLGAPGKAIIIPRGGFYQETGGQWIFVLNQNMGVASRRAIKLGRQNPEWYEIIDGLKENESVIISGYTNYEKMEELIVK